MTENFSFESIHILIKFIPKLALEVGSIHPCINCYIQPNNLISCCKMMEGPPATPQKEGGSQGANHEMLYCQVPL
jgi:hypothetical protein